MTIATECSLELRRSFAVIPVLTSKNLPLTKTWRKDGTIEGYGKAKWFTLKEEIIEDIEGLSALLTSLESRPYSAIIRGQYVGFDKSLEIPETEDDVQNRAAKYVRRTLEYFKDCPQPFLLVEVDNFVPQCFDPIAETEDAIREYILGCLPPQFHDVAYHWQLSSSAGHPSKKGSLRVHLWFWLKEPATSGALRAWAESIGLMCDRTVFNPVQVHYTSAPIVEKGAPEAFDTLRSCFYAGSKLELDLTEQIKPYEGQLVESRRDLAMEDEELDDPRFDWLLKNWTVLRKRNDGDLDVRCPFDFTHDGGKGEKAQKPGDSSTIYFRAGTNGFKRGHWKCQHHSCFGRTDEEFDRQVGYDPCEFQEVTDEEIAESRAARDSSGVDVTKLVPFDLCALQGQPVPRREWLVEGWLPWHHTTLLYGDGGVGKGILSQQLSTCVALGLPWLGLSVKQCRVMAVYCEDDDDELHRRQADINAVMGIQFSELENFKWISRVGSDNLLMTFNTRQNGGMGKLTQFWYQIVEAAKKFGAQFVILDTAADCFGGNEIDRSQVRQFIQQVCTGLAREIDGAVLLCAHPSVAGLASGKGTGGSTAWSNSGRGRLYLTKPELKAGDDPLDSNRRTLTKMKANYSSTGDSIALEWHCGVFRLVQELANDPRVQAEQKTKEKAAKEAFLRCLEESDKQGRSTSDSKRSPYYAPKQFVTMPEGNGFNIKNFEKAMAALFNSKTIKIGTIKGPDRKPRNVIVRIDYSAGGIFAGGAGSGL